MCISRQGFNLCQNVDIFPHGKKTKREEEEKEYSREKNSSNINIIMLGCIVSGRLVQTDFQQIEQTKWVINIPEADSINYVVVFLTGQIILPEVA